MILEEVIPSMLCVAYATVAAGFRELLPEVLRSHASSSEFPVDSVSNIRHLFSQVTPGASCSNVILLAVT